MDADNEQSTPDPGDFQNLMGTLTRDVYDKIFVKIRSQGV